MVQNDLIDLCSILLLARPLSRVDGYGRA